MNCRSPPKFKVPAAGLSAWCWAPAGGGLLLTSHAGERTELGSPIEPVRWWASGPRPGRSSISRRNRHSLSAPAWSERQADGTRLRHTANAMATTASVAYQTHWSRRNRGSRRAGPPRTAVSQQRQANPNPASSVNTNGLAIHAPATSPCSSATPMVVDPQKGHNVCVSVRHGHGMLTPVIAYIPLSESPIAPNAADAFRPDAAEKEAAPAVVATPPLSPHTQ